MSSSAPAQGAALADWLVYLETLHPKAIDLGLDRIRAVAGRLGLSLDCVKITVAGTNGKGSTCAMLEAMLLTAGYKVGKYTSPHLLRFNERIVLAGREIEDAQLEQLLDEALAHNKGRDATFFEITTAMAFAAFARTPADVLLLETGLGGRLDCTNVITRPAVTIITPIGMDHMEFLGGTLEKIAGEKAGIMKRGVPCIVGPQENAGITDVFARRGAEAAPKSIPFSTSQLHAKPGGGSRSTCSYSHRVRCPSSPTSST